MNQADVDSLQQLNGVGVAEIFEQDPRPTFILDLDPDDLKTSKTDALDVLFCNEALRSHHVLLDSIMSDSNDAMEPETERRCSEAFRTWAESVTKFDDSRDVYPFTHVFHNMLWTGSTIRKRWRVISGNQYCQPSDLPSQPETVAEGHKPRQKLRIDQTSLYHHNKSQSSIINAHAMVSPTLKTPEPDAKLLANGYPSTPRPDEAVSKRIGFSSRSSTGTGKTSEANLVLALATPESATPDWTVNKPRGVLSEHLIFARSIDWASTPMGAMKTWSKELRQAACLVMSNPHPAALFWGSDLTILYNEAYKNEVACHKHPSLMGTGAEGPFREIWETVSPIFVECARTGKSIRRDNDPLHLERAGFVEECYFSWSFTPLYSGGSKIKGFYNAPFETTRDVVSTRRMHTLQKLVTTVSTAKSVKEFWQQILVGLEDNHYDVPFALLYSVLDSSDDADELSVSSESTLSLKSCILEGSIAVPDGHAASPTRIDLKRSREGFIPSFREAMRTREPTRLQVRDGSLPEALLEGIEWRGFGEPCKDAIIFPIRPTNGDSVLAFLLLGINPRRPFDDDYQAFAKLLNRNLATALASVMLFEDEMHRTQDAIIAAELQQEQLNEQLAIQTNRLQRMTALSPLGMFYVNSEGLILEANDRYFEMTGQDRGDLRAMSWMDQLVESSKPIMLEGWKKLTAELTAWTSELQLKIKRFDPTGSDTEPLENWVLASSQPEIGPDGRLRSVMGSITDISHLKWAQGLQERRIKEAEERRRQQNEFIDITSHEMRNPLSAILQCADDISSTMAEYQAQNPGRATSLTSSCVESANTIVLCVQHQKSIVDDILTVSKLDSNLLQLAPIPSQPLEVARGVMRMFESELLAKKIKSSFIVNPDYRQLKIDSVSMDHSRISQILINLMTNAIKFTNERAIREIRMHIGASFDPPNKTNTRNFQYVPRKKSSSDTLDRDWNTGESVYIRLKVEDTGCGLTPDEIQLLFQRFQQASPRTHAQYGGSGLGLFISRQLTELHGGQIGVASKAGEGSTFGFYIRARRLAPPKENNQLSFTTATHPPLTTNNSYRSSTPTFIASHIEKEMKSNPTVFEVPVSPVIKHVKPATSSSLYILVVEDNLVNQKVLTKQLQKTGAIVSVADNGQKALDYLETTEFFRHDADSQKLSIVLMDLEMPVMDGLTCVRRIRQLEKEGVIERHVPVIAVTANVRLEQVLSAREAGMDEVVSKPFRIPELMTKINVLLNEEG